MHNNETITKVLAEVKSGKNVREIAKAYKVSAPTIYAWIKKRAKKRREEIAQLRTADKKPKSQNKTFPAPVQYDVSEVQALRDENLMLLKLVAAERISQLNLSGRRI